MAEDELIQGIEQIHITVSDLDASVNFYHHVLGLPLQFVVREQNMAFISCGDIRLYLGRTGDPKYHSRPMIYFKVEDIQNACKVLTERGVEITSGPLVAHQTETLQMWLAGFADPDGNPLCLTAYTEREDS